MSSGAGAGAGAAKILIKMSPEIGRRWLPMPTCWLAWLACLYLYLGEGGRWCGEAAQRGRNRWGGGGGTGQLHAQLLHTGTAKLQYLPTYCTKPWRLWQHFAVHSLGGERAYHCMCTAHYAPHTHTCPVPVLCVPAVMWPVLYPSSAKPSQALHNAHSFIALYHNMHKHNHHAAACHHSRPYSWLHTHRRVATCFPCHCSFTPRVCDVLVECYLLFRGVCIGEALARCRPWCDGPGSWPVHVIDLLTTTHGGDRMWLLPCLDLIGIIHL